VQGGVSRGLDPARDAQAPGDDKSAPSEPFGPQAPQLGLPKGGGAVRGIGEKFSANPVTGTGTLSVPIATSPGRSGFGPRLSLTYDSGSGNGPFGFGWSLALPAITRKTDKGLPRYQDARLDGGAPDVFILSGAEDLVPVLIKDAQGNWQHEVLSRNGSDVARYRPRIEGLFSRIERWTSQTTGDTHWRSITKDNVTTFYGESAESRICDPRDATRIFSWLICRSQDDKGNVVTYGYAAEDSSNVDLTSPAERNRTPTSRTAQRYPKCIRYGNTPSLLVEPDLAKLSFLFEVVFDYGDGHYQEQPPDPQDRVLATATIAATQPWPARQDPFSRYRSRFDVRTYRLCRRVLMFHHFATELGAPDYLVRATELSYDESPIASRMIAATQAGFVSQGGGIYLKRMLPPLEFSYSEARVHKAVHDVDADSLANIPAGIDGPRYRWLDLDGEGLQGVFAEAGDGWYYKRNLTPLSLSIDSAGSGTAPSPHVTFEPLAEVTRLPGAAAGRAGDHQFMDFTHDGRLDCVVLERPGAGYYERSSAHGWEPFTTLPFAPNLDWSDPNMRMVDVDGDGFSDLLISEHEVFTYYPALARFGFGAPVRVPKATDEELGPAVLFADSTHAIFLADMSGDGLADIVRIRNGEVCYWPNLGYGAFGAKVSMAQAPWFDRPDLFDQKRIRLADVDGSGVTDIIYLARDGVRIYFNQAGNAWSDAERVADFPPIDDLTDIQALDLLGNGTACLVWTSSQPGDAGRTMRYIDLMGREKPYLLTFSRNNIGAETRVSYAPSTAFYLADRAAGRPWATRLPFPVHVVERVETLDWISRNRFVTRYAYHHGYYDGLEREFRGFGMVEQTDTEELGVLTTTGTFPDATNIDATSYVPPVLTKTWFHTGAYPSGPRVTRIYDHEYWHEPGLSPAQRAAMLLDDSALPADITGDELHEALRSLKGAMLRQEVYALDATHAAHCPYAVTETNYTVNRLQPFGDNRHAVFFTHERESLSLHYERALYPVAGGKLADPRVSHKITLAVDPYGNELQSAAIAYGRRYDDPDPLLTADDRAVQRTPRLTYTQRSYTKAIHAPDAYRAPLPADVSTYELVKVTPDNAVPPGTTPAATMRFGFNELAGKIADAADGNHDLLFSDVDATQATQNAPFRRPIAVTRSLYRTDDLSGPLMLGRMGTLALPFCSYKLALTADLLGLYQRGAENLLPAPASVLHDQAGYVAGDDQIAAGLFPASDRAGNWWLPSGEAFYSATATDPPATELSAAQANFFQPCRYRDAFGAIVPPLVNKAFPSPVAATVNDMVVTYDAYGLLVTGVTDAAQNTMAATNDYRVLQPYLLTDANNNQSAVAFDCLGLVVGTAVTGKAGELLGDTLTAFMADLNQLQIDQFFTDPKGPSAATLLGNATSRIVYDVGRFTRAPSTTAAPLPSYAATIARETHVAQVSTTPSKLQVAFAYSDGLGRAIQRKAQAEPGALVEGGAPVVDRWVGSGWVIYNNKGKPVRQYEPFFDDTHDFKFGAAVGVSPTLFYDPVGRVVATLNPDHSFAKVVFDPWRQDSFDANDTVMIADPSADPDVGAYFARIPTGDYMPGWFAQRSGGAMGLDAKNAAQRASIHAGTPATAHFDAMGQPFLTLAFNRYQLPPAPVVESHDRTLVDLDIAGNQRAMTDALGRAIVTCDYDVLGTCIRRQSVDAGTRWMLNNVAGKSLLGWDSRDHRLLHEYDVLRRPLNLWLEPKSGAAAQVLAERAVFGEGQPKDQSLNLRGKPFQQYDGAGLVTNTAYDVKGNLLASTRELRQGYADQVDWSAAPARTGEVFQTSSTFDALNRVVTATAPDASVIPASAPDASVITVGYNAASLLAQVTVNLRGATAATPFVTNIDYDAKGQRQTISYGNGSQTAYTYDANTFRLTSLTTTAQPNGPDLQALVYTYDPVGNITHIADTAQQTIFFANQVVDASGDYTYDARYRLIQAQGRELIGLANQPQTTWDDGPRLGQALPLATQTNALQRYTETYQYDPVGNFLAFIHAAAVGSWTRTYQPTSFPVNNQVTSTTVGANVEVPYSYDAHGNLMSMPHLTFMAWDFKDQLQETQQRASRGPVETTYYVYDSGGQRVRKVNQTAAGATANERIYLGGFEIYREYAPTGTTTLERQSLHVMDDKRRIALIETTTVDASVAAGLPSTTTRYQYDNHLGSACLELDDEAAIISYEEYYPYGSTSYQAGPNAAQVSLKRYRYTGKERDEENGFYYHGARYYAPWLGRWTSCDPAGLVDGVNLYAYTRGNPIVATDPTGTETTGDPNVPKTAATPSSVTDKELREAKTLEQFYPDGDLTSPKTPAVDITRGTRPPDAKITVNKKGVEMVEETKTGGEWIQVKELDEGAKSPIGARIASNITKAMEKFGSYLQNPKEATRGSSDGSRYLLILRDPEALTVHLEVPGFAALDKAQQESLQKAAGDALSGWQEHFEGIKLSARVTDVPGAPTPPPPVVKTPAAEQEGGRTGVTAASVAETAVGVLGAVALYQDLSEKLGKADSLEDKASVFLATAGKVSGLSFAHGLATGLGYGAAADLVMAPLAGMAAGGVIRTGMGSARNAFGGAVEWAAGAAGFDLNAWNARELNQISGVKFVQQNN
jgi:RHS repeat-associated protein